MIRLRINYSKDKQARYTSVLDLQKTLERAFRRASLPVIYSQGFHPQPKIHFAAPLPLGFSGLHELLDVWFEDGIVEQNVISSLAANLPEGIVINSSESIPLDSPNLQSLVISAEYHAVPLSDMHLEKLPEAFKQLLQRQSILRERRGKQYDLRPLIQSIEIVANQEHFPMIKMQLECKEGATGRPDEVIGALGFELYDFSYCRHHLVLLPG